MCLALKTNPIKSLAESHTKVKFDQIHQPPHQPYASISSEYMHFGVVKLITRRATINNTMKPYSVCENNLRIRMKCAQGRKKLT